MGLFDFLKGLFGGGGGGGDYERVVAWVKTRHRDRFRDGMTVEEVRSELVRLRPKDANAGFAKALQSYIAAEEYGDLVRVRED